MGPNYTRERVLDMFHQPLIELMNAKRVAAPICETLPVRTA